MARLKLGKGTPLVGDCRVAIFCSDTRTVNLMQMWTVDKEFELPIRHFNFNMSGGSFYVNFTLRLTPNLDDPEVHFETEVDDEEAEFWIPYIEEGIHQFLQERRSSGKPVGHLHVALIDVRIHPIDSKSHRFRQAGVMAMTEAFEKHGIDLGEIEMEQ